MYRDECPMCRAELIKYSRNEDDEEYSDDEDEDEEEDEEEDDEDEIVSNITVEQITNKMRDLGYSMEDMVVMMMDFVSHEKDKQNDRWTHIDSLRDSCFNDIFKITRGDISVDYRDGRSYAQVLLERN
jgi:hypothetical protein